MFGGTFRRESWQQFQRPCKARSDADDTEVTAICSQYSVDLPSLGDVLQRQVDWDIELTTLDGLIELSYRERPY